MIGFYVLRGHDHDRLIRLSELEKRTYHIWMQQHYEEEEARYKAIMASK